MYEDRPYDLLKDMADKGVLVEVNLTSNEVILGIEGKATPSHLSQFGVPVALSTDDEGVSRIDLLMNIQRAVENFGLAYAELKELVRNSIEYSFLPGPSLWDEKAAMAASPTAGAMRRARTAVSACASFSPRARRRSSNGSWRGVSGVRGRASERVQTARSATRL